jgi:hypothetical protein
MGEEKKDRRKKEISEERRTLISFPISLFLSLSPPPRSDLNFTQKTLKDDDHIHIPVPAWERFSSKSVLDDEHCQVENIE